MPYPYTYRISENDSADSENSPAYTRECYSRKKEYLFFPSRFDS